MFSCTLNISSSFRAREKVSYPYITDKTIVLNSSIFTLLDRW
jgi:hypothetical protein